MSLKSNRLFRLMFTIVPLWLIGVCSGQDANSSDILLPTYKSSGEVVKEPYLMTPTNFESWILLERRQLSVDQQKPSFAKGILLKRVQKIESVVIQQLGSGKYLTDKSIQSLIYAWRDYEVKFSPAKIISGSKIRRKYTNTKRVIDKLRIYIFDRLYLQAQLHQIKANLFEEEEDSQSAISEHEESIKILAPLQLNVDNNRLTNSVEVADLYYWSGQKAKAEELYLRVKSYPWYNIDTPAFKSFEDLHLRACRGLINVRRGDLAALKEIRFEPAIYSQLGFELAKAIEDAGGEKAPQPIEVLPSQKPKVKFVPSP